MKTNHPPLNQSSLKEDFQKFKYAVFIGRFQPMLWKSHYGLCLKEYIVNNGLIPIVLIGSPNSPLKEVLDGDGKPATDKQKVVFRPHENPLTYEQRLLINEGLIKKLHDEVKIDNVPDFENGDRWINFVCQKTLALLNRTKEEGLADVLFFSVSKAADNDKSKEGSIAPMSEFIVKMKEAGFGQIYSPIQSNDISASTYRVMSVDHEFFLSDVVGAKEIAKMATEARYRNNWLGEFLNNVDFPITMIDLSLDRISKEIAFDYVNEFYSIIQKKILPKNNAKNSNSSLRYSPQDLCNDIRVYFNKGTKRN